MVKEIQNVDAESSNKDAAIAETPSKSTGLSRKQKVIRWGSVVLILLACAFFVPYYFHALSHESTDDAFIEGTIVSVSPKISGHVTSVYVNDNQWVKKGDLLVELDSRDFEIQLEVAKAELASAKATEESRHIEVELTKVNTTAELAEAMDNEEAVKAVVEEEKARLSVSKAEFDEAIAEAERANSRRQIDAKDLKRFQEMAKFRTISEQDLDHAVVTEKMSALALMVAQKKADAKKAEIKEAEAALKTAEANLRKAHARVVAAHSAPKQVQRSRFQADASRSNVDFATAKMAQSSLNLAYTKISAPCDGFVTKKRAEPGQFVQVGQTLMAIVPPTVWVTANFKETQLTHMKPGQPVDISVDAYPDLALKGHVDSIQRGTGAKFSLLPPENATGHYVKVVQRIPVKIFIEGKQENFPVLLTPGMSVVPDVNVGGK